MSVIFTKTDPTAAPPAVTPQAALPVKPKTISRTISDVFVQGENFVTNLYEKFKAMQPERGALVASPEQKPPPQFEHPKIPAIPVIPDFPDGNVTAESDAGKIRLLTLIGTLGIKAQPKKVIADATLSTTYATVNAADAEVKVKIENGELKEATFSGLDIDIFADVFGPVNGSGKIVGLTAVIDATGKLVPSEVKFENLSYCWSETLQDGIKTGLADFLKQINLDEVTQFGRVQNPAVGTAFGGRIIKQEAKVATLQPPTDVGPAIESAQKMLKETVGKGEVSFTFDLDAGKREIPDAGIVVEPSGVKGTVTLKKEEEWLRADTILHVDTLRLWPKAAPDGGGLKAEISGMNVKLSSALSLDGNPKVMVAAAAGKPPVTCDIDQMILRDAGSDPAHAQNFMMKGVHLSADDLRKGDGAAIEPQAVIKSLMSGKSDDDKDGTLLVNPRLQIDSAVIAIKDGDDLLEAELEGLTVQMAGSDKSLKSPLGIQALLRQTFMDFVQKGIPADKIDFALKAGRYHFKVDGVDVVLDLRDPAGKGEFKARWVRTAAGQPEIQLTQDENPAHILFQLSPDADTKMTFQGVVEKLRTEVGLDLRDLASIQLKDFKPLHAASVKDADLLLASGLHLTAAKLDDVQIVPLFSEGDQSGVPIGMEAKCAQVEGVKANQYTIDGDTVTARVLQEKSGDPVQTNLTIGKGTIRYEDHVSFEVGNAAAEFRDSDTHRLTADVTALAFNQSAFATRIDGKGHFYFENDVHHLLMTPAAATLDVNGKMVGILAPGEDATLACDFGIHKGDLDFQHLRFASGEGAVFKDTSKSDDDLTQTRMYGSFDISGKGYLHGEAKKLDVDLHGTAGVQGRLGHGLGTLSFLPSQLQVQGNYEFDANAFQLNPGSSFKTSELLLNGPTSARLGVAEIEVAGHSTVTLDHFADSCVLLNGRFAPGRYENDVHHVRLASGLDAAFQGASTATVAMQWRDQTAAIQADLPPTRTDRQSIITAKLPGTGEVKVLTKGDNHLDLTTGKDTTVRVTSADSIVYAKSTDNSSAMFFGEQLLLDGRWNPQDNLLTVWESKVQGSVIAGPLQVHDADIALKTAKTAPLELTLGDGAALKSLPENIPVQIKADLAQWAFKDGSSVQALNADYRLQSQNGQIVLENLTPEGKFNGVTVRGPTDENRNVTTVPQRVTVDTGFSTLRAAFEKTYGYDSLSTESQHQSLSALGRVDAEVDLRGLNPQTDWREFLKNHLTTLDYDESTFPIYYESAKPNQGRSLSLADITLRHEEGGAAVTLDKVNAELTDSPQDLPGKVQRLMAPQLKGDWHEDQAGNWSANINGFLDYNSKETATKMAGVMAYRGVTHLGAGGVPNDPDVAFSVSSESPVTVAFDKIIDGELRRFVRFQFDGVGVAGTVNQSTGAIKIPQALDLLKSFGVNPTDLDLANRASQPDPDRKLYEFKSSEWMYDVFEEPAMQQLSARSKIERLQKLMADKPQFGLNGFIPGARVLKMNYDTDFVFDPTTQKPLAGSKMVLDAYFLIAPEKNLNLDQGRVSLEKNTIVHIVYDSQLTNDLNEPISGKLEVTLGVLRPGDWDHPREVVMDMKSYPLEVKKQVAAAEVPLLGLVFRFLTPEPDQNPILGLLYGSNTKVRGFSLEFHPNEPVKAFIDARRDGILIGDLNKSEKSEVKEALASSKKMLEKVFETLYTWNGGGKDLAP